MAKIIQIEGIGETYAQKLREFGITTTEDLLQKVASPQGMEQIAEQAGISQNLILEWVNHADLIRVKGVGGQYADLLESAGVDSVAELAHRSPENLFLKMAEVNESRRLVRRLPSESLVVDWIVQAQNLPRLAIWGSGASPAHESAESPIDFVDLEEALPGDGGTENIP